MLHHWKLLMVLAASFLLLAVVPLQAQAPSLIDTFRIIDTTAVPGEIVPLQFYVANDSCNLAGIAAYFKIDNSVLEWVGEWDSVHVPPTFLVKYDTLPRADLPNMYEPVHLLGATYFHDAGVEFGLLVGAGYEAAIPKGRGSLYQMYVRVKSTAEPGTQTLIEPFDPIDLPPHDDLRFSQFSDITGTIFIEPTLVAGTLDVAPLLNGDFNRDGLVNISDVTATIDYIFDGGDPPNPYVLGDANCDGIVNITDAVYFLNYIFNGGPPPDPCL